MSETILLEEGGSMQMSVGDTAIDFVCLYPIRRDGIYKVWMRGDGGELLLGTLIPEGERLALRRRISSDTLRRCGCFPVRGAYRVCTQSFGMRSAPGWYREACPQQFVDAGTRQLGVWRPMLCRKGEGWTELAWRMDGGELPMSHLFCLARPVRIGEELYLVWRFRGDGMPIFPNISGE